MSVLSGSDGSIAEETKPTRARQATANAAGVPGTFKKVGGLKDRSKPLSNISELVITLASHFAQQPFRPTAISPNQPGHFAQPRWSFRPTSMFGLRVKFANRFKKQIDHVEKIERLYTFDPQAVQKGVALSDMFANDEVEEDFNEVVDQDDERVEEVVSQELVGQMVEGTAFRFFILGVIVINTILIGLGTNEKLSEDYSWLFTIFDYTVLTIFTVELLLKWFSGFFIYWRVGWNVLDFFIILTLLMGPTLTFLGSSRILRILRVIRAFRNMTNIVLLLVIVMVVLSVAGVSLFGKDFPEFFENLGAAMFSLFICVTQDGWMGIFEQFQGTSHYLTGGVYFIICVIIGAFVFANLVVAVVVTNLDKAMNEVKEENKQNEDLLATKPIGEDDPDYERTVPIVSVQDALTKVNLAAQKPLFFGDFKYLTQEKLEHYIIVLMAIEDNLVEYKKIHTELEQIFSVIWNLNYEEGGDDDDDEDKSDDDKPDRNAGAGLDFTSIGRRGDILSNLLELEKHNLISTSKGIGQAVKEAAKVVDQSKVQKT
ncbi:putative cation channel sperm-associated protein 4-like [Apostichopus japonicus]|uniref:Putative cation channel sperm-associated protein 4-like n=1 Tax=Stichopus japonicus TaxID=307972 RepID=A0A2G8LRQ5_STIJA|nr:putative cation channel sperm-associated protein 4-like [Apostichopus japonicus]